MKSIILLITFAHIYNVVSSDDGTGRNCTISGLMCSNCTELVSCVAVEDSFNQVPIQTCPTGETCMGTSCTTNRNPRCEDVPDFPCNDIGVFPDPFDCQSYHFCVPIESENLEPLQHYEARCDGSFGYHAGTTFCQTRLDNNVCFYEYDQFPIDLCLYSGQTSALAQNPTIYYICAQHSEGNTIIYPFQFVCPHGGTYYNYQCVSAFNNNLNMLMSRF